RYRVVETRHDVEPIPVQHEAARAAAAHGNVVGRAGREGVVLDLGGGEPADLARSEGSNEDRRPIGRDAHRGREAVVLDPGRARNGAVYDVLVQVPGVHTSGVEHADPRLVQVAPYRGRRASAGTGFRPLESHLVPSLGVGGVDLAVHRVHGEVED